MGDFLGTENAEVKTEMAPVPSCPQHSRSYRCAGTIIRQMQSVPGAAELLGSSGFLSGPRRVREEVNRCV